MGNSKDMMRKWCQSAEYRKKWRRTLFIGFTFLALGGILAQRGPSFLDLQLITQSNVESASLFFTAGSIGYLVGSLVAGVIYDKINKSLLLIGCVLGLSITNIITPWCSLYSLMIVAFFFCFMFGGGLDTAGNAELVRIWGKEGDMAMQFLHFSFAFGGIISPLVTEPFLVKEVENELEYTNLSVSTASPSIVTDSSNSNHGWPNATNNKDGYYQTTQLHLPFLISGIGALLASVPLVVEWFCERSQSRQQKTDDTKTVQQPLPWIMLVNVLCMVCVFYFLYCAVEDTFAAYLATFVVKQLLWSKSQGARITSVYWTSFASFRFLNIFIAYFVSPVKLLFTCCLLIIISMLGLLLSSQYQFHLSVWICTFCAGASMSAVFPTGFTWIEMELLRVTGRVASIILIASSSGTMTNPIVLGFLMQAVSPMWFIYVLITEACLCFCVFVSLLAFSRLYLQKHYIVQEMVNKTPSNLQNEVD